MTDKEPIRVFGVTSLCSKDPMQRYGSEHLFFFEFDDMKLPVVREEARRIHKTYGIDIYTLQSSKNSYHILTFDILPYILVNKVGGSVRLPSDYPILTERFFDCFLTLRIWVKGKKQPPKFISRFVSPNEYKKSYYHYEIYKVLCGLPTAPKFYRWSYVIPYFASYLTKHNV